MKNPKKRCRDCKLKYAQEMGLCRSCQKQRLGNEGCGATFVLSELTTRAKAKGLVLCFDADDGTYSLVNQYLRTVHQTNSQKYLNRFLAEYRPTI